MKISVLLLMFLLVAEGLAHANADVALPNINFEEGLAHWKVLPSAGKGAGLAAWGDSGPEGKLAVRLTSTSAAPKMGGDSERFPVAPGMAYRLTFQVRNIVNRSGSGVFIRFLDAGGKELNNVAKPHDTADQDLAIVNALTGPNWTHYEVTGYPPEGTVVGSLSIRAWCR